MGGEIQKHPSTNGTSIAGLGWQVVFQERTSSNSTHPQLGRVTSWWLFTNPVCKICNRQIGSFPQGSVRKQKIFETTTQIKITQLYSPKLEVLKLMAQKSG